MVRKDLWYSPILMTNNCLLKWNQWTISRTQLNPIFDLNFGWNSFVLGNKIFKWKTHWKHFVFDQTYTSKKWRKPVSFSLPLVRWYVGWWWITWNCKCHSTRLRKWKGNLWTLWNSMILTKHLKNLGFRQKTSKMWGKIPGVWGPIGTNGFLTSAKKVRRIH